MTQAIVSFFAIIDPVGNIVIFHLFTAGMRLRDKLYVAVVAVAAAYLMLLAFSLGGEGILDLLGISLSSFQVAAGLLLIPPAYRLVMEGQPASETAQPASPLQFAIVPLATPLIAGPGALAATAAFAQRLGTEETIGAFSLVLLLTLVAFAAADFIFRLLGVSVLRVISRVVGILLFAIAVDFVLEGVFAFIDAAQSEA